MTTRTQNDVRNFNEAINKCRMPVFLVSSDGTRYNMKSADQNVAGMDRWIRDFSEISAIRWRSSPAILKTR